MLIYGNLSNSHRNPTSYKRSSDLFDLLKIKNCEGHRKPGQKTIRDQQAQFATITVDKVNIPNTQRAYKSTGKG